MSLFIYVFCQKEEPIRALEITEFIEEGAYFERPVKATMLPASAKKDDTTWTELALEYALRKRPVILHQGSRAEQFKEEVGEAIEALESAGLEKKHSALVAHLKATRLLVVFELDPKGTTEECWEMVDNLEGWIARERQGLVYVSGEGFYDAALQPICKLRG